MHQRYPTETRDWNVSKAYKMLVECLQWRIQNEVDNVLTKPMPADLYKAVRDSQLVGLSGYSKQCLLAIATGVGLSTFDKASRSCDIAVSNNESWTLYWLLCESIGYDWFKTFSTKPIEILTAISKIDALNYAEKTDTYHVVNSPYIFSACWKVARPLARKNEEESPGVARLWEVRVTEDNGLCIPPTFL
ncbi:Phosphatidylinositol/phosphatidylcholine transfer protein [Quillaja saponaria]|uniref:Phosphatidylinositol/phosphatidylcholine transfer protein n=1 Tax=Quillaja saponaria TaxID=32244 RepID=A0AAD7PQP4_QUISA|nr:Phosphatidylinositol/phosphatidylcholine transfer protein [Quillaja saponaria]